MTESSQSDLDRAKAGSDLSIIGHIRGWFGAGGGDTGSVREVIEELIEEQPDTDDAIDAHERILLSNVLSQRDVTVEKIMVPRADIVPVDLQTSIVDVVALLVKEGHSRVPVFRGSLDEVVGMVHIKDLANALIEQKPADNVVTDLSKAMRPVIFVAPTARVLDLLLDMRLKRTHMAMVIDEYGGIDGLVTIEDLVEQIVGEIADEHDEDEDPELIDRADGSIMADARVTLIEFVARYGNVFSEDDMSEHDTLGGLVIRLTGRVPSRGELVTHDNGLEFEIVDADPRRIRRLRLRNLPKPSEDE